MLRLYIQLDASHIVDANFERNTALENALTEWAEHREVWREHSSSFAFTQGEGYWSLVEMGPSIVAHIMLDYYDSQGGWHHELLHELVHSEKSGSSVFFKPVLFASWQDWFEHKDWKDVPRGMDAQTQSLYGSLRGGLTI